MPRVTPASLIILSGLVALSPMGIVGAAAAIESADPAALDDGEPPLWVEQMPAASLRLEPPLGTSSRGGLATEFIFTGELPEGDTASGIQFTPDGTRIVVAHRTTQNLIVFDAATRTVLQTIELSGSPNGLAVATSGTYAVTANVFEDNASIVNLTTGVEEAVVPVGDQPGVVRITPDGTTAVVGNTVDSSVSVIDIGTASEVRRIAGLGFVASVSAAFEPGVITAAFSQFELASNTTLVHPDYYAAQIHLVDITTGSRVSLPSAANPRGIAVTPDGLTAVVSHPIGPQLVTVVDVAAQTISKTIPIGADLFGAITVNPTGSQAVVAVQNACRVVDLVTNGVSGDLATASVNELLTTADGNYALGVGYRGALIEYATQSIVGQLNNIVSTPLGAVSPVGPRAAMVANTFGEDLVVVNTNGALGSIEGVVPSGPPPEGDNARHAAISADGSIAVVLNILSDNATIVDLGTSTVEAIVDVGDRPSEVAITPDGSKAIVANLDSNFASVIDLGTFAVTNVPISRRGSQVEVSPDGTHAYVAVVADGDGVWRINLDTLAVEGPKLLTGNMGGIFYLFSQSSGMTLSHDGATLVTCDSYTNALTLIDTATWSVVASVPINEFPVRAVFSSDDATIYVSAKNTDAVVIVSNAGAASSVIGTIPVGDQPLDLAVSSDGSVLYVANFAEETVGIFDLADARAGALTVATVPVPSNPSGLHLAEAVGRVYVASGSWSVSIGPGPVFSIGQEGAISAIDTQSRAVVAESITDLPSAMLAFNDATGRGGVPSPFGDGLTAFTDPGTTALAGGAPQRGIGLTTVGASPVARGAIRLGFALPTSGQVRLDIQDALGRRVRTLVNEVLVAGEHVMVWDGRSEDGKGVPAGVYFARLATSSAVVGTKLTLLD